MWEGRFKSSLVDKEAYCLACYRYIELNPVRARMVRHPARYRWSSFNFNALGEASDLLVTHNCWLALGNFKQQIEEALSIKLRDGKRGRPKTSLDQLNVSGPFSEKRIYKEAYRQVNPAARSVTEQTAS